MGLNKKMAAMAATVVMMGVPLSLASASGTTTTTSASTTTTTTTSPTTQPDSTTTTSPTTQPDSTTTVQNDSNSTTTVTEDDQEKDDKEKDDKEKDDHEKDDKEKHDQEKHDKKKHDKKKREDKYKHAFKGIEKAIDSLKKALSDGKGQASDQQLEEVIAKLTAMLKQDGTATTDQEAEEAVEADVENQVTSGTADVQSVQILVKIKEKKGKDKEAVSSVETALKHDPKEAKLYNVLGDLFAKTGDNKDIKIFVQGGKLAPDVQPFVKNDRTMVPIRFVTEALGAQVAFDNATQTATITKGTTTIKLTLGSDVMFVNGQEVKLDAKPETKNYRTFVPVRFITEYLNQSVDWNQQGQFVIIN